MLFNRHLFIITFSIFFIGVIFWWQNPNIAVTAMTKGDFAWNSYTAVKSYWTRLDNRQFDLAEALITPEAAEAHNSLQARFDEDPFLSIQKIEVENTYKADSFICKVTMGSVIEDRKEHTYSIDVNASEKGWRISSIKKIL